MTGYQTSQRTKKDGRTQCRNGATQIKSQKYVDTNKKFGIGYQRTEVSSVKVKLGPLYETQKKAIAIFVFGLLFGAVIALAASPAEIHREPGTIANLSLIESPPEGAAEIIKAISEAEEEVLVSVYFLNHRGLLTALEAAAARGVEVKIIVDEESPVKDVKGCDVRVCHFYKLYHTKFLIVDKYVVFIGSHNFTNAAFTANREASIIMQSQVLAESLAEIFETDWARSIE
jgi:hypothetical protein